MTTLDVLAEQARESRRATVRVTGIYSASYTVGMARFAFGAPGDYTTDGTPGMQEFNAAFGWYDRVSGWSSSDGYGNAVYVNLPGGELMYLRAAVDWLTDRGYAVAVAADVAAVLG